YMPPKRKNTCSIVLPTNCPVGIVESIRSNIVTSRIFSAYFLTFALISAANAEKESAFFEGSFGQNRHFRKGRKATLRAGAAAAQVARSRPGCTTGKSLFGADRRGVRGMACKAFSYALKISTSSHALCVRASLRKRLRLLHRLLH